MKRFLRRLMICLPLGLLFHFAVAETPSSPSSPPKVILAEPHPKIVSVDPPPLPEMLSKKVTGGVYNLLVDQQHLVEEKISYTHYATYLASQEGLQENSQIEVSYDPGFQSLKFHFVRIRRGAEIIDCWDANQIQLLQRENEMERHIFDGSVSAILVLNGLRIGDVVDYAYSIEGRNPVFGSDFYFSFYTRWSSPVEQVFQRVVTSKKTDSIYRLHENNTDPEIKENGEDIEWLWKETKVPAVLSEDQTPDWLDAYAWVEVGSYKDWKQVQAWGHNLYQPSLEAPLPAELETKLEEIRKQNDTPLKQASATLQLVQDEIRYLGFEMGAGSYMPNPPALVWQRRFGDCKDKALLLSTLLRHLGLDAEPALVNTSYRGQITNWIPSPQAFDHVVVRFQHEGKTYWIDPTRSGQRGPLDQIYIPDYKQCLLFLGENSGLTAIAWKPPEAPLILVAETFKSDDFESPVHYEIKTRYRSYEADRARVYFRSKSREKIEQGYLEYYTVAYPHLRRENSVTLEDNEEKNEVTIQESYLIDDFWKISDDKKEKTAEFDALMIRGKMTKAGASKRRMPLEVSYPVSIEQKTRIFLPKKWPLTPDKITVTSPYFDFFFEQKGDGNLIELEYRFKTLANEVPPAEVKDYGQKMVQARENIGFWVSTPLKATAAAAPEKIAFHPNWPIICVTLLLIVGLSYLAYRLVKWVPIDPYPPCPPDLLPYKGLRGWLFLVGFGISLRPIVTLYTIFSSYHWIYSAEAWESLTSPSSAQYHMLWAPLLLTELAVNLSFAILGVALVILFFRRRRHFPAAMLSFLVCTFVFLWTDYAVALQLPGIDPADSASLASDAVKTTVQAAIWIPYFLVSKRVKATFRR